MIKKRKRYIRFVILTVVCLVLAGVSAVQCLFYFQMKKTQSEIMAERDQYSEECVQKQAEIDSLKQQIDSFIEQIQLKDAKIREFKEKEAQIELEAQRTAEATFEAEPEEVQGMVKPSGERTMFSDENFRPGDIITEETAITNMNYYFDIHEIMEGDSVFQRINGKSYRENDDIALNQLRYLTLLHYNFNHEVQVGEMIVNAQLADDVIKMFKELFQNEYEIESIRLIDDFWEEGMDGNDADYASIEVNNTSAFNYRPVSGGGNLSQHALGRAIDINPQQNPYVTSGGEYSHANAAPYIDRTSGDPHVIVGSENDIGYSTFTKYGFSWGGAWSNPIDYQHFEKRAY